MTCKEKDFIRLHWDKQKRWFLSISQRKILALEINEDNWNDLAEHQLNVWANNLDLFYTVLAMLAKQNYVKFMFLVFCLICIVLFKFFIGLHNRSCLAEKPKGKNPSPPQTTMPFEFIIANFHCNIFTKQFLLLVLCW